MESYARTLSYGCYFAARGVEAGAGSGYYLDVGDAVEREEVRVVKAVAEAELVVVFVMIPYSKLRMC